MTHLNIPPQPVRRLCRRVWRVHGGRAPQCHRRLALKAAQNGTRLPLQGLRLQGVPGRHGLSRRDAYCALPLLARLHAAL